MYNLCTKVLPLPDFVVTGGAGEGGCNDICCVNWFCNWSQDEFSGGKGDPGAGDINGEFKGEPPEETELLLKCVLIPKDATEVVWLSFILYCLIERVWDRVGEAKKEQEKINKKKRKKIKIDKDTLTNQMNLFHS